MKYVALLRGINVGGNKKVEMPKIKKLFESLGFFNISTYINSGNIVFESKKKKPIIQNEIESNLKKEFGFDIPTLVKTHAEMKKIASAIPLGWKNNIKQKTDVAYLFKEIDSKRTIEQLPIKREYLDVRYVKGAIFWNVLRKNYNKSQINKLIGHKFYKLMTVRNVNTARFLANTNN